MKSVLMSLSVAFFAIAAQAFPVNVSTNKKTFKTFSRILMADVAALEKPLRIYMEDSMGCSKVRLNLSILKEDSFFGNGLFSLNLAADCASNIRNLQLDFDPLCSPKNNGEAALVLNYVKFGHTVSKHLIVNDSQSCQE